MMIQATSFIHSEFDHFFSARGEAKFTKHNGISTTDHRFNGVANLFQLDAEVAQYFGGDPFSFTYKTEQEMFCANVVMFPRDTQRVSQEGEKALKNEQKRQKSGYLRENSLAGRCWKEWKQRVAYGTVTPRWEKEVCYRIPFKEQVPQTYPLLGTML